MTKFLGLKPFRGRSLDEVINYLRVDVAGSFKDLFSILGLIRLSEAYVSSGVSEFEDFTGTGVKDDVASITLPAGEWSVFGVVFFYSNGAAGSLTSSTWISTAPASSSGTTRGQSLMDNVLLPGGTNRPVYVFRRLVLGQRSNVYLGASAAYTGGPVQRCGSIWALGRQ